MKYNVIIYEISTLSIYFVKFIETNDGKDQAKITTIKYKYIY